MVVRYVIQIAMVFLVKVFAVNICYNRHIKMTFISQDKTIQVLRLSLGITFFWFGILKLFDSSPVTSIIKQALPQAISDSNIFFYS